MDKLVSYFVTKMSSTPAEDIDGWEALLERALKMFHPQHYVVTLIRIAMNTNYIRWSFLLDRIDIERPRSQVSVKSIE